MTVSTVLIYIQLYTCTKNVIHVVRWCVFDEVPGSKIEGRIRM